MTENCRAIIMAGGEGSRLRPITCTLPKPLVPILGKPIIDYCLELLKNHGITDVTTTVFYLGDMIKSHLGNGDKFGMCITHSATDTPLGTAGSIKICTSGQSKKTTVVISGDTLTDCDLSKAIEYHRKKKSKLTIVLKRVSSPTEYGVALTNSDGQITRFLEKPERSEVFSDFANTGIYIIEPEIIEMIPDNTKYDFSCDLFPKLLNEGTAIYGYEMDGYWCDVGDIRQYLAAQRDMLDGKVELELTAQSMGNIYVEEGAKISDNAILRGPCYIASGAEIGEKACIDAYSVISGGVRLFANATTKRCVIMNGSTIRENAEIRGGIICQNVHIDRDSSVFEDCVIGEGVSIGKGAVVFDSASIWPYKQVYDAQKVSDNIVWGTGKRIFCQDTGITGYCDTDISPETAVRIGAAFAKIQGSTKSICVASDGKRMTSMLKRSVISGIISQGIDVFSLPHMPYSLFSFAVQRLGVQGGIYISSCKKSPHTAHMTICDSVGIAIDAKTRRKLHAAFSGGEIKPVTYDDIGIVEEIGGTVRAYEAELLQNVNTKIMSEKSSTVVLDVPDNVYDIAACALLRVGWSVVKVNSENGEKLYSQVVSENAAFGCYIADGSETAPPSFLLANGKSISGMSFLATVASDLVRSGKYTKFSLPATFPDEYARYLMNKGASIDVTPEEWHSWRRSASESKNDIPDFFDQIGCILKICEMYSKDTLYQTVEELPEVYLHEEQLPCTWDDVGVVLRTILSDENVQAEQTDGIKIRSDKGWVIVKAGNEVSSCRIICGSFNEEYASELSQMYVDKLSRIINPTSK